MSTAEELPYVDEHRITVAAPRGQVWTGLRRYLDSFLAGNERSPLTRLLGTEPRAGFEIAGEVPQSQLDLTGRHRFSRYRLEFQLAEGPGGQTLVTARTHAAFPGRHGRLYRALVIGTHAHVVATDHVLRGVRLESLATSRPVKDRIVRLVDLSSRGSGRAVRRDRHRAGGARDGGGEF